MTFSVSPIFTRSCKSILVTDRAITVSFIADALFKRTRNTFHKSPRRVSSVVSTARGANDTREWMSVHACKRSPREGDQRIGKGFGRRGRGRNEMPVVKLARVAIRRSSSMIVAANLSATYCMYSMYMYSNHTKRLPAQSQRVLRKPNSLFSKMIHQIGKT